MLDAHLFLFILGNPADCASLGISGKLFDGLVPDLVGFGF
jgi:5'-nucleotidase